MPSLIRTSPVKDSLLPVMVRVLVPVLISGPLPANEPWKVLGSLSVPTVSEPDPKEIVPPKAPPPPMPPRVVLMLFIRSIALAVLSS